MNNKDPLLMNMNMNEDQNDAISDNNISNK